MKKATSALGLGFVSDAAASLRQAHSALVCAPPVASVDEDDLQKAVRAAREALTLCNDILHRNGKGTR